jgi:PKD repeat protein
MGFLRTIARCSLVILVLMLACVRVSGAATSTAQNPVVTFGSQGAKQVQLQACNANGCSTVVKTVVVRDPRPSVTSLSATPASVVRGGVVHLSGTGLGAPPLTFSWRILNGVGTQVAALTGAQADWSTSAVAPGDYTIFLDLTNAYGAHTPFPTGVTVTAAVVIFADGFESGVATGLWRTWP